MYQLLCGSPPFDGMAPDVLRAQVMDSPPALTTRAPHIPHELAALAMRLLHKAPEGRYRDAHHLLEALEALSETLPAEPMRPSILPAPVAPSSLGPSQAEQLEQQWNEQLRRLTSEAEQGHGGAVPESLSNALGRAGAGLALMASLRKELSSELARGEGERRERRERAARVHAALDALARDQSAVAREIEQLDEALELADREHQHALSVLCTHASAEPTPPQAGELLSARRAQVFARLALAARELAASSSAVAVLRRQRALRAGAADDLRFQIDQLKGRIALLHAEARNQADAARTRLASLDARHQAAIEAVAGVFDELDN
jgi:hypothetical protein